MHHSELRQDVTAGSNGRDKRQRCVLLERGQVNAAVLAAAQAQFGAAGGLALSLDAEGKWGYPKVGPLS